MLCLASMACYEEPVQKAKPLPAGPEIAIEPDPICTHEVCFNRVSGLDCNGNGPNFCYHYRIQYEYHCDCDRWAPAPSKVTK
jgi:hypothetical protein